MFVMPGPDPKRPGQLLKIMRPGTKTFLPQTGAEVPPTSYWLRLKRDGDVLEIEPPKKAEG